MTFRPRSAIALGAVAAAALSLLIATPAQAADRATGAIGCNYFSEIHTASTARGTVTHQIYGARQPGSLWETTSSMQPGYSAKLAKWDTHHWAYVSSKGGKAFGTEVSSASVRCA